MADDEEGRNFEISDSDVYGNSREINEKELKTICEIKEPIDTTYNILGIAPEFGYQGAFRHPKSNAQRQCCSIWHTWFRQDIHRM